MRSFPTAFMNGPSDFSLCWLVVICDVMNVHWCLVYEKD